MYEPILCWPWLLPSLRSSSGAPSFYRPKGGADTLVVGARQVGPTCYAEYLKDYSGFESFLRYAYCCSSDSGGSSLVPSARCPLEWRSLRRGLLRLLCSVIMGEAEPSHPSVTADWQTRYGRRQRLHCLGNTRSIVPPGQSNASASAISMQTSTYRNECNGG